MLDTDGELINNKTFGYKEIILILSLMAARLIIMTTLFRIKDQKRRITTDGILILPPLAALYLLNLLVNVFTHHF